MEYYITIKNRKNFKRIIDSIEFPNYAGSTKIHYEIIDKIESMLKRYGKDYTFEKLEKFEID